jgi:hypothetical protein
VSAFGIKLINKYNKKLNLINKYNKKMRYNSTMRNIVNNVILLYCIYKGLSTKSTAYVPQKGKKSERVRH